MDVNQESFPASPTENVHREAGNPRSCGDDHCASEIFASLTTFFHFSTSRFTVLKNCSGEPPAGSTPSPAIRFLISSVCTTFPTSLFHRATISLGKSFGPQMPYQKSTSKPGTVSPTVGTCGSAPERVAVVTPMARNRPAFTCGMVAAMLLKLSCTSPPICAVNAGAAP